MNERYNQSLKPYAQKLRREMTREEKHLWYDFLKQLPFTVQRQKVFGNYIVDFYIAMANIAIEIDGSQHFEEAGIEYDQSRDLYFNSLGIHVLR